MKKIVYVGLFTFLGVLVAAIVHGVIEAPLLWLIEGDMERYGESFIWQNWTVLHRYVGGLIWVLGIGGGLWAGLHFWQVVYGTKK